MIMPIVMKLRDLELNHVYLVAAVAQNVGVSFQARLLVIEAPTHVQYMQWVLHFSGGLTLRLDEYSDTTFFEVLEEL